MAASEYSLLAEIKLRTTVTEICSTMKQYNICDVLCDLVPFAQFKKSEKHPWRGVVFSKVAG